jgi:rRNA biogenesis protein RRP5
MQVQGYVRSVSTKGMFVVLDRSHDARVKLSQLSDGFVEDPAAAFPVGSRVEGRIASVEHTKPPAAPAAAAVDDGLRVELSLRSGDGPGQLRMIKDFQDGELTIGKVCMRVSNVAWVCTVVPANFVTGTGSCKQ